ncbi:MAG: hypothetical protein MJK04_19015 [Psychrosphaera sp.]|nr:hypothetical protein [Psychrosphaera sp.]
MIRLYLICLFVVFLLGGQPSAQTQQNAHPFEDVFELFKGLKIKGGKIVNGTEIYHQYKCYLRQSDNTNTKLIRFYESFEKDSTAPKDNDHWLSFAFVNAVGIEDVLANLSPATARKKDGKFQYDIIYYEKQVAAVRRLCDDYKKKVDSNELGVARTKSVYSTEDYSSNQAVCIVDQAHKSNHKACKALTDEDINTVKQKQLKEEQMLREGINQLTEERRKFEIAKNSLQLEKKSLQEEKNKFIEGKRNQQAASLTGQQDSSTDAITGVMFVLALVFSFLYFRQRYLTNMYDTYLSPMYRKYTESMPENDDLTLKIKLQRLSKDHNRLRQFLFNQNFYSKDTDAMAIEVLTERLDEYKVLKKVVEMAKVLLNVKKETSNRDFFNVLNKCDSLEKEEIIVLVKLTSSLSNWSLIDELGNLTHTKACTSTGLIELFENAPLKVNGPLVLDIPHITDSYEIEVVQDVFKSFLNITTESSESKSPAALPAATSDDQANAKLVQTFKRRVPLSQSMQNEDLDKQLNRFFDEHETLTKIRDDLRKHLNASLGSGTDVTDAKITETVQKLLDRYKSNRGILGQLKGLFSSTAMKSDGEIVDLVDDVVTKKGLLSNLLSQLKPLLKLNDNDDNSQLEPALSDLKDQKNRADKLIGQFRQKLSLELAAEHSLYTEALDEQINELRKLKNKQDELVKVLKLDKDLQKLAQVKGQGTIDKIRFLIEQRQQGDQSIKALKAINDWLCTKDPKLKELSNEHIPQAIEEHYQKISVFEDKSKGLAKQFVAAQTALKNALKKTKELEEPKCDELENVIDQMSYKHDLSKRHDIEKWQRGISSVSVYVVGSPALGVLVDLERPLVDFYDATLLWLAYHGIRLNVPLYSVDDKSKPIDNDSIDSIPGYLQVAEQLQWPLVNHLLKQTALNLVYLQKLKIEDSVLAQLLRIHDLSDYNTLVLGQEVETAPLVTRVTEISLIKGNQHYGDTFVERI